MINQYKLDPNFGDQPLDKLLEQLATGFGLGRMRKAPGTFGTLLGIPLVGLFSLTGPLTYVVASLAITIGAIYVAEWYERRHDSHDPKEIVIDEVAGYFIAMALIPFTWQGVLASFVLFRFFDAVKPFPISYVDKNVEGGIGTVADDVLAGVISNIILQVIYQQTTFLGSLPG
jgi:phosphatidylglycerophosphatase A